MPLHLTPHRLHCLPSRTVLRDGDGEIRQGAIHPGAEIVVEPDWGDVGRRIGNAITAACFGTRGELRERVR